MLYSLFVKQYKKLAWPFLWCCCEQSERFSCFDFVSFSKSMQIKKPEKTSSVTSHSNEKILVCNHVRRQPRWLTKQYNFFRRICLNKEFISQFIFLKSTSLFIWKRTSSSQLNKQPKRLKKNLKLFSLDRETLLHSAFLWYCLLCCIRWCQLLSLRMKS